MGEIYRTMHALRVLMHSLQFGFTTVRYCATRKLGSLKRAFAWDRSWPTPADGWRKLNDGNRCSADIRDEFMADRFGSKADLAEVHCVSSTNLRGQGKSGVTENIFLESGSTGAL